MHQEFTIQGQMPTSNEIIAASKSHYMAYANMKKDYTALAMISSQNLKKITNKIDLQITWYRKDRRSDPDNIAGGVKFILDGLVKGGKLKNDGWRQINSIAHKYAVDKDNPRVEVMIKEV